MNPFDKLNSTSCLLRKILKTLHTNSGVSHGKQLSWALVESPSYSFSCFKVLVILNLGFPRSSAGKESACNAEDPSSIPASGRSLGEGIGYLLQCSWASLVAQRVKRPEFICSVGDLGLNPGLGRSLEEGMATHSSILAWRTPWTEEAGGL